MPELPRWIARWFRPAGEVRLVARCLIASLISTDPVRAGERLGQMIDRTREKKARGWDFGGGLIYTRFDGRDLHASVNISQQITIMPSHAEMDTGLWEGLPETVRTVLVGRRLGDLVGHPAITVEKVTGTRSIPFDGRRIVIELNDGWISMRKAREIIAAADSAARNDKNLTGAKD